MRARQRKKNFRSGVVHRRAQKLKFGSPFPGWRPQSLREKASLAINSCRFKIWKPITYILSRPPSGHNHVDTILSRSLGSEERESHHTYKTTYVYISCVHGVNVIIFLYPPPNNPIIPLSCRHTYIEFSKPYRDNLRLPNRLSSLSLIRFQRVWNSN